VNQYYVGKERSKNGGEKWKFSDKLINVRQTIYCKVKTALTETVTVTSKGQVTIPSKLRRELKINEGEKLLIIREDDAIKMIPIPKLSKLAGVDEEVFRGKNVSAEIKAMRKEWTKEFDKRTQEA